MQITIDSNESLAGVLRVVGSLYGVTLTTSEGAGEPEIPRSTRRSGRPSKSSDRRRAAGESSQPKGAAASPRDIRRWATEQGMTVSGRGALSKDVRDAYSAANA